MDGQKCSHAQCSCYVELGRFYCGDRCRDNAGKDDENAPHGRCGCGHAGCLKGT